MSDKPRTDAATIPQPNYKDLWDAFVNGALEGQKHPEATEFILNRSADAYCKLWHLNQDPEGFHAFHQLLSAAISEVDSRDRYELKRQRDDAINQLARICREGFGDQNTIGQEPADEYILRQLAAMREQIEHLGNANSMLHLELVDAHAETAKETKRADAMREAIKEAASAFKTLSEIKPETFAEQLSVIAFGHIEFSKLQPFLKP